MSIRLLLAFGLCCLLACGGSDTAAPGGDGAAADASGAPSGAPPPGPAPRRTLPDAVEVMAGTLPAEGLTKVDLAQMRGNGTAQVDADDPAAAGSIDAVLDGDPATLARSNGINPMVITITFTEPVALKAARIFPTYSAYDWVLEAQPGERLMVKDAPSTEWSAILIEKPKETSVVRLEVLRLERDNFVHLNDIELYR